MAQHWETQSSGHASAPGVTLGNAGSREGEPMAGCSIAPTSLPQSREVPLVALGSVSLEGEGMWRHWMQ